MTLSQSDTTQINYKPPNDDTQNPHVPPHFYYSPAMAPLTYEEGLVTRPSFREFKTVADDYFTNLPFFQGFSGRLITGPQFDIISSEEHPLVVYVMITSYDIPHVTKEIRQTCLRLVQKYLPAPVPPFRFYVSDMVLY